MFACNVHTDHSAYVCCKCERVKAVIFFMMCVFTKAHSFSVVEHTQPVKTIRATGLKKMYGAASWDAIAIPDETASRSVEIQH